MYSGYTTSSSFVKRVYLKVANIVFFFYWMATQSNIRASHTKRKTPVYKGCTAQFQFIYQCVDMTWFKKLFQINLLFLVLINLQQMTKVFKSSLNTDYLSKCIRGKNVCRISGFIHSFCRISPKGPLCKQQRPMLPVFPLPSVQVPSVYSG